MAQQLKVSRHYTQSVSFTNELTVVVTLSGSAHFMVAWQVRRLAKQGLADWQRTVYLGRSTEIVTTANLDNPLVLVVVPRRWSQAKQVQRLQQLIAQVLQQQATIKLVCALPLKFTPNQRQQISCWLAITMHTKSWLTEYFWSPRHTQVSRDSTGRITHASYQRLWRADIFSS
ncbi:hypothetical protein [Loigolactobacillus coryniformis]|uniref:hypothetical protein n=1 Tax=Loigolactobacillus coryniformis TaxID=1610 RepID=UPI00345D5394